MMGLYMAEDFASKVGMTDTGMGTESGSPNAETTDTTAYGIQAIKKPAQISIATWERIQSNILHIRFDLNMIPVKAVLKCPLSSFSSLLQSCFVLLLFFPTPSLQPLTHLCEFHLKDVAVFDAGIKV